MTFWLWGGKKKKKKRGGKTLDLCEEEGTSPFEETLKKRGTGVFLIQGKKKGKGPGTLGTKGEWFSEKCKRGVSGKRFFSPFLIEKREKGGVYNIKLDPRWIKEGQKAQKEVTPTLIGGRGGHAPLKHKEGNPFATKTTKNLLEKGAHEKGGRGPFRMLFFRKKGKGKLPNRGDPERERGERFFLGCRIDGKGTRFKRGEGGRPFATERSFPSRIFQRRKEEKKKGQKISP